MGVVPACKDRGITFRHLANMTSGYLQPERPGLPRDITMTLGWSINNVMIPSLSIVQVCAGNAQGPSLPGAEGGGWFQLHDDAAAGRVRGRSEPGHNTEGDAGRRDRR
jgi:hypothetical protein